MYPGAMHGVSEYLERTAGYLVTSPVDLNGVHAGVGGVVATLQDTIVFSRLNVKFTCIKPYVPYVRTTRHECT